MPPFSYRKTAFYILKDALSLKDIRSFKKVKHTYYQTPSTLTNTIIRTLIICLVANKILLLHHERQKTTLSKFYRDMLQPASRHGEGMSEQHYQPVIA